MSAAGADIAHPTWRGSAIGVCRFWRDLGYGALILGAAAAVTGALSEAFWTMTLAMALSRLLLPV